MKIVPFYSRVFATHKFNERQGVSPTNQEILDRLPTGNELLGF
jgi:hypothetical protein